MVAKLTYFDIESTNLNANYGYILCIGWKHLGEKKVHCASIDQSPGFKKDPTNDAWVVKTFADEIAKSDIVCGWYSAKFDWPFIQSRLLAHGLPTMPPIPHVDLWRTAKYQLKLNSNRLASVSEFLKLEEKTPIRSREWIRAMAGHRPAIKYVVDHCLTPEHRVLTSDLRWRALGDLRIGDPLIAFTEDIHHPTDNNAGGRYYQRAEVESVSFRRAPCCRVILGTGEEFICTPDHLWLVGRFGSGGMKWVRTDALRSRSRGKVVSKLTRLIPRFTRDESYDAGWLAGIIDGEGSSTRRGMFSVSQRPGVVLDQILRTLGERVKDEVSLRLVDSVGTRGLGKGDCHVVHVRGSLPRRLALLGAIRPERIINKLDPNAFGRIERRNADETTWIEHVEPCGEREIAVVNTTSRTFICEGYPMHNCIQDIVVLEQAYLKMRPVMKGHPNVNIVTADVKEPACPICGSKKLQKRGISVAGVGYTQRYHCQSCGGWSRGRPQRMDVEVR